MKIKIENSKMLPDLILLSICNDEVNWKTLVLHNIGELKAISVAIHDYIEIENRSRDEIN